MISSLSSLRLVPFGVSHQVLLSLLSLRCTPLRMRGFPLVFGLVPG